MTDEQPAPPLGRAPQTAAPTRISFGTTPRAAALPALAPPPAPAAPPTPTSTVAPARPVAGTTEAARPRSARTPRPPREPGERPAARAPRGARGRKKPKSDTTGVYLSVELRARLRRYHKMLPLPRPSYSTIFLDAVDANRDRLADLLGRPAPRPAESLFVGRESRIERHDEDQVQVTLRVSDADRETLDALVDEYGATNRSALMVACLVAYLDEVFPAEKDDGDGH